MSLAQLRTYLQTDEAKKDLVEKAREAGFDVNEEDLSGVAGGLNPDESDKQSHTLKDGLDVKDGITLKGKPLVKDGTTLKDR